MTTTRYINRRTYIVFDSMASLNNAVDYMLALNKPFNTIVKKPVMIVTSKIFNKQYLDLLFSGIELTFTTFKIKQVNQN